MAVNGQGILVAATDQSLRERVARALEANGLSVFRCADMAQAEQALHGAWVDAVAAQLSPALGVCKMPAPTQSLRDALRECERQHIERVLAHCRNNKAKASRILGIGLSSMYRKLDEYGFTADVL
jgi:DNA-binding NtrC family response regulator